MAPHPDPLPARTRGEGAGRGRRGEGGPGADAGRGGRAPRAGRGGGMLGHRLAGRLVPMRLPPSGSPAFFYVARDRHRAKAEVSAPT
jgi:hypothetical protein